MDEVRQMLSTLSRAVGTSGAEESVIRAMKGYLSNDWDTKTDAAGNLLVTVCSPQPGYPHLLLDAHMDEIGMVVTEITEEGFLRVAACGGIDRKWLPAQEVTVHGSEPLSGVICAVAPHLQSKKEQNQVPEWNNLLIDIGFSKQEAQKRVSPGTRVTIVSPPASLGDSFISGKAMDNRAGVTAILLAANRLQHLNCPCGVSLLFSVEEEITGKGASVGAFDLSPNVAISVDVSFAQTPGIPTHQTGQWKKGPMIGISPTLTKWVSDQLSAVAREQQIPHQYEVMGGATSTNADHFGLTGRGIPVGLCSIPERYMHTPVETVAISDIEDTAQLLSAFAISLCQEGN